MRLLIEHGRVVGVRASAPAGAVKVELYDLDELRDAVTRAQRRAAFAALAFDLG